MDTNARLFLALFLKAAPQFKKFPQRESINIVWQGKQIPIFKKQFLKQFRLRYPDLNFQHKDDAKLIDYVIKTQRRFEPYALAESDLLTKPDPDVEAKIAELEKINQASPQEQPQQFSTWMDSNLSSSTPQSFTPPPVAPPNIETPQTSPLNQAGPEPPSPITETSTTQLLAETPTTPIPPTPTPATQQPLSTTSPKPNPVSGPAARLRSGAKGIFNSGAAKNLVSKGSIAAKRLLSKAGPMTILSGGIGATAGMVFGGLSGAVVGAVGGGFLGNQVFKGSQNSSIQLPSISRPSFPSFNLGGFGIRAPAGLRLKGFRPNLQSLRGLGGNLASSKAKGAGSKRLALFLLGLLLFLILIGFFGGGIPGTTPTTPPGTTADSLKISKTGPNGCTLDCKVNNNDNINYSITVTYTGTGTANVEITDTIPENTTFVYASENGKESGGVVKWQLNNLTSNRPTSVSLTVKNKPDKQDIWAVNFAEAKITSSTGGGGTVPPTGNDCGGAYDLTVNYDIRPSDSSYKYLEGSNWGDPSCAFTQNDLLELLQQLDPSNANYWFSVVVACETGHSYNPNIWRNPNLTPNTPDPNGAWGLYQMGSDSDGNGEGINGPYDRGDVHWELQTTNAVNYKNEVLGGSFGYWACAGGRI